jgi:YesN/AraC family two-component response regulator
MTTTTSLTASADETIRQLKKQWKTDKDCFTTNLETPIDVKLAAMDTKIEHVLSSLHKTIEQAMKNSMASFKTKITTMATDLITTHAGTTVTQVATSMSGINSPFVTAKSLHHVMEKFIDSVNTRIDTLTTNPSANNQKPKTPLHMTPRWIRNHHTTTITLTPLLKQYWRVPLTLSQLLTSEMHHTHTITIYSNRSRAIQTPNPINHYSFPTLILTPTMIPIANRIKIQIQNILAKIQSI